MEVELRHLLLGAALIDRDTHPISLTPAGEEFLPYASRILGDLEIGVGVIRKHASIRATGNSISLVRCDDPLAAADEGKVDVALVRGTGQGTRSVRIVHLSAYWRAAKITQPMRGIPRLRGCDSGMRVRTLY